MPRKEWTTNIVIEFWRTLKWLFGALNLVLGPSTFKSPLLLLIVCFYNQKKFQRMHNLVFIEQLMWILNLIKKFLEMWRSDNLILSHRRVIITFLPSHGGWVVRAVALQYSKTAILLRPRFESRFGHNIIVPFSGDHIAVI